MNAESNPVLISSVTLLQLSHLFTAISAEIIRPVFVCPLGSYPITPKKQGIRTTEKKGMSYGVSNVMKILTDSIKPVVNQFANLASKYFRKFTS